MVYSVNMARRVLSNLLIRHKDMCPKFETQLLDLAHFQWRRLRQRRFRIERPACQLPSSLTNPFVGRPLACWIAPSL